MRSAQSSNVAKWPSGHSGGLGLDVGSWRSKVVAIIPRGSKQILLNERECAARALIVYSRCCVFPDRNGALSIPLPRERPTEARYFDCPGGSIHFSYFAATSPPFRYLAYHARYRS